MTDGQLVTPPVAGAAEGVTVPWRSVVDACAWTAGPFVPSLLTAWRRELDDVQQRVAALRGDVPVATGVADPLPVGVHALLTLAGARLGALWRADQLIAAAAAVELARRAVLQHEAVRDRDQCVGPLNKQHVLRGDWSITQAARLVADIGPSAYRLLVRGWGAAQLTRLHSGAASARNVLFDTAISLGALTAGVPTETSLRLRTEPCVVAQVLDWAARL